MKVWLLNISTPITLNVRKYLSSRTLYFLHVTVLFFLVILPKVSIYKMSYSDIPLQDCPFISNRKILDPESQ